MLTFNDILRVEGVNPASVRLVRHEDQRLGPGRLYMLWRDVEHGRALFEQYQQIQGKRRFSVGEIVASFVVMPRPARATLFVGLYDVMGVQPHESLHDPVVDVTVSGYQYDLMPSGALSEYVGRLTIEWGAGTRTWVQRADIRDKPVVAIESHEEPPWPGFSQFYCDVEDVPGLYESWQQVLRTVKGVYLLVDRETGDRYVGSAKGQDSLFGRFLGYASNGHGGNVELRRRPNARYRVSLLEVVDLSLPDKRIEEIEAVWKEKLMTREHGLNRN
jgi:hypothetical protein